MAWQVAIGGSVAFAVTAVAGSTGHLPSPVQQLFDGIVTTLLPSSPGTDAPEPAVRREPASSPPSIPVWHAPTVIRPTTREDRNDGQTPSVGRPARGDEDQNGKEGASPDTPQPPASAPISGSGTQQEPGTPPAPTPAPGPTAQQPTPQPPPIHHSADEGHKDHEEADVEEEDEEEDEHEDQDDEDDEEAEQADSS